MVDAVVADDPGKNQHGNAHAQHLPHHPHGRLRRGCEAVKSVFHGTHNGIDVGRRKKRKPDPQQSQTAYNAVKRRIRSDKNQSGKADHRDRHADGRNDAGLVAIGQPPGQRREDRLQQGFDDQNKAGLGRRKSLDVLQIKTQQESDREGGAIMNQSGKIGKSKNPVAHKQVKIDEPRALFQLPANEDNETDAAPGDQNGAA